MEIINNSSFIPFKQNLPSLPPEIVTQIFLNAFNEKNLQDPNFLYIHEQLSKNYAIKALFHQAGTQYLYNQEQKDAIRLIHLFYTYKIPTANFVAKEDEATLDKIIRENPHGFFYEAIKARDNAVIEKILKIPGFNPKERNIYILYDFIENGNAEGLKMLLKTGLFNPADPAEDRPGDPSPLLYTLVQAKEHQFQTLIHVDSTQEKTKKVNQVPQYAEIIQVLTETGGVNPLLHQNEAYINASAYGLIEVMELLETLGANPGDQANLALIHAAKNGEMEAVTHLLAKFDPALPIINGDQALLEAYRGEHTALVNLLGEDSRISKTALITYLAEIKHGNEDRLATATEILGDLIRQEPSNQERIDELLQKMDQYKVNRQQVTEHLNALITHPDFDPNSNLKTFCQYNLVEEVRLVVDDPRISNESFIESFRYACQVGAQLEIIKLFLSNAMLTATHLNEVLELVCEDAPTEKHASIALHLVKNYQLDTTFDDHYLLCWAVYHNFNDLAAAVLTLPTTNPNARSNYSTITAIKNQNITLVKLLIYNKKSQFEQSEIKKFIALANNNQEIKNHLLGL